MGLLAEIWRVKLNSRRLKEDFVQLACFFSLLLLSRIVEHALASFISYIFSQEMLRITQLRVKMKWIEFINVFRRFAVLCAVSSPFSWKCCDVGSEHFLFREDLIRKHGCWWLRRRKSCIFHLRTWDKKFSRSSSQLIFCLPKSGTWSLMCQSLVHGSCVSNGLGNRSHLS